VCDSPRAHLRWVPARLIAAGASQPTPSGSTASKLSLFKIYVAAAAAAAAAAVVAAAIVAVVVD
jgi:hypothetical protein